MSVFLPLDTSLISLLTAAISFLARQRTASVLFRWPNMTWLSRLLSSSKCDSMEISVELIGRGSQEDESLAQLRENNEKGWNQVRSDNESCLRDKENGSYCLMLLQMNHSTTGVGCPLVMHTTDWPEVEPWWRSIKSTMTAGTATSGGRGGVSLAVHTNMKYWETVVQSIMLLHWNSKKWRQTFNLQDEADITTLVSILHMNGVVSTVLLLDAD